MHKQLPLFFIVLLCVGVTSCQKGAPESQTASDSWLEIQKSMSKKKPLDPPMIETLFQEEHYVFNSPDDYERTWVHRFKILTENAREEYGVFVLDYNPWHESKPVVEVSVTQPDGAVVGLDPSTLVDQSTDQSGQVISNGRRLTVPLPQLKVGSVVNFKSISKYRPSVYGPAMSSWMTFGSFYRDVQQVRLVLDFPATMEVKLKRYAMDDEPVESVQNGRKTWVFERKNMKRIYPPEDNIPEKMVGLPMVLFATGESWGKLAEDYYNRVAPVLDVSACEAGMKSLIPPKGDARAKLDGLLANLKKKVRYTGLELGENAIVPVSPCETLKRGFGDCKDQAALVVAALDLMGMDANLVLVDANFGLDVEPELPSLTEFNHVIVRVNEDTPIWIDPTLAYGRVGELSTPTQERNALIVSKRTDGLTQTPKRKSSENTVYEKRTIEFAPYGKATVIEETEYTGTYERYERGNASDADEASMFENLEKYIKGAYSAKSLGKAKRVDPNDLSETFKYWLEGKEIEVAATDLTNASVALTPRSVFNYLPDAIDPYRYDKKDTEEERLAPFSLGTPGQFTVEYVLKAPEEYNVKNLPKDEHLSFGSFAMSTVFKKTSENEVSATFKVDTGNERHVDAKLYQKFRQGLLDWVEELPIVVTFEHIGMGYLATGDYKKALTQLQESEQTNSHDYLRKLRYASALLDVGFGKPAHEEALKATKQAPDKSEAWHYLGWILEHDDLGRRFGKDYDRNGAIDAYRRAVSADREDVDARFSLAILLEHDQDGDRYLDADDLKKAINEYHAILEIEEDNEDVKNNMIIALAQAGDFEALRMVIKDESKTDFFNSYRVICTAALEGAAAAIQEAQELFDDVDNQRNALGNAVSYLVKLGKFSDCASLIREAYKGVSNAEALARAKYFDDLAAYDASKQSDKIQSPEDLAAQFLMNAFEKEPKPLKEYWAPSLRKWLSKDADEDFSEGLQQKLKSLSKSMPHNVLMAMMANIYETKKEGNDKDGYRVVMQTKVGGNNPVVLYVVKEKGKYWLAAIDDMSIMGYHVLALIEQGRLDVARKWLDWGTRSGQVGDEVIWKHNCEGDELRAKIAAWYMLSDTEEYAKSAVSDAEKTMPDATGDNKDRVRRVLYVGYFVLKRWKDLYALAEQALGTVKDKTRPFFYLRAAALNSARYKELEAIAEDLSKKDPDEKIFKMAVEKAQVRDGEFNRFWKERSKTADTLEPSQYNLLAWLTLFETGTLQEGLDFALKAVQLKERYSRYKYHTLASIYAEMGKTAEAHQIMKALNEDADEPESGDWFILGRMAEHYNLKKIAIDYYCNVESPEVRNAVDTYHLARKRLKKLKGKCKK